MTRPIPSSGVDGASYTALPANDGEERAMVETAIVEFVVRDYWKEQFDNAIKGGSNGCLFVSSGMLYK